MSTARPDDPAASEKARDAQDVSRIAIAAMVALAIIALGAFVLFEALTGPGNPGYATVGPGAFPGVVGAALVLAGIALLLQARRGQWQVVWVERGHDLSAAHPRERGDPVLQTQTDDAALGPRFRGDERERGRPILSALLIAAALVLNVVLMQPLGFIIASAILFALVAAAFGSRRFVLDAALGLLFAGAIYLVFVHGLGLHLPPGSIWESLLWRS